MEVFSFEDKYTNMSKNSYSLDFGSHIPETCLVENEYNDGLCYFYQ